MPQQPVRSRMKIIYRFDEYTEMQSWQLELAWLASIFNRPVDARKSGMMGLDRSMFERPELFDLGLEMLRSDFDVPHRISEPLLNQLIASRLLSRLTEDAMTLWMYFLPSFYPRYAAEIERRSHWRFE